MKPLLFICRQSMYCRASECTHRKEHVHDDACADICHEFAAGPAGFNTPACSPVEVKYHIKKARRPGPDYNAVQSETKTSA
jgi:hypothetical protein